MNIAQNFLDGWLEGHGGHRRGTFVATDIVRLCGGNGNDAILFSQILYWNAPSARGQCKLTVFKHGKHWLAKRYEDWEEETGINAYTARNAIKRLVSQGLIETKVMKWAGNPTTHIALCHEALEQKLTELYNPRPDAAETLTQSQSTYLVDSKLPDRSVPLTEITPEITPFRSGFSSKNPEREKELNSLEEETPKPAKPLTLFNGTQPLGISERGWIELPTALGTAAGHREHIGLINAQTIVWVKDALVWNYPDILGVHKPSDDTINGPMFSTMPYSAFLNADGPMSLNQMRAALAGRVTGFQDTFNTLVERLFWMSWRKFTGD